MTKKIIQRALSSLKKVKIIHNHSDSADEDKGTRFENKNRIEDIFSKKSKYLDYEYLFELGKPFGLNNVSPEACKKFINSVTNNIIESEKKNS